MSFCSRVSGTPLFQSTLSVRRATARLVGVVKLQLISIHALRKESDFPSFFGREVTKFQSTLSVRRATRPANAVSDAAQDFNPRSP